MNVYGTGIRLVQGAVKLRARDEEGEVPSACVDEGHVLLFVYDASDSPAFSSNVLLSFMPVATVSAASLPVGRT